MVRRTRPGTYEHQPIDNIHRSVFLGSGLEGVPGQVTVLGVDDWAKRKGARYGTILIDLERRTPVDLLPDREVGTLHQWLAAHPEIEIVSRDRAAQYAEAARSGET